MSKILDIYSKKVKNKKLKIIYDEIQDTRIQKAIIILQKKGFNPVITGTKEKLQEYFGDNLNKIEHIIMPQSETNSTFYAGKLLNDGIVDGLISGSINPTSNTLRALIKNVGVANNINKISGFFMMETSKGIKLFSDCAVQPNPTADELAEIGYLTGKSGEMLGLKPRIAMLSFSTKGSANHEMVQKVKDATQILKNRIIKEKLNYKVEGEIQLDAAISPIVAKQKIHPQGEIMGDANIFVFPDLNSGNIGYKLVQYFSKAIAVGPIIQGLKKPGNDLSRGCNIQDIMLLHIITSIQIQKQDNQ